jgi:histidyl-tRNA synthetase
LIVLVVQGEIENGLVTLKDMNDRTETKLDVNHLQEAVCRVFDQSK